MADKKKKKSSTKTRKVAKKQVNSKIQDKKNTKNIKKEQSKKAINKTSTKTVNKKNSNVKKDSVSKKNVNSTTKSGNTKKTNEAKKTVKKNSGKTSTTKKTVKKTQKSVVVKDVQDEKLQQRTKSKKEVKIVTPKEEVKPVIEKVKKKVEPVQQKLVLNEEKTINKKIKNASKNYIIIFLSVLMLIVLFLVVTFINKKKNIEHIEFEKISFSTYLKIYEKKDLNYIYITSNNCIGCNLYEQKLDKLRNEYNIVIKKLNISDLKDEDIEKLKNNNIFIANGIEPPVLLSVKEGKSINGISGNRDYQALKNFVEYSIKPVNNTFSKISVNKYISLLNAKEASVIFIGESTNTTCQEFSSVLENVAGKKGIKVNYLNTEEILSEDNWKKLEDSSDLFSKTWFVPTILIVKDGKIKDYKMENLNEQELLMFFNRNGF